jgi:hypothetical protein
VCDNLLWNKFNGMPFKSNVGRYLSHLSVGRIQKNPKYSNELFMRDIKPAYLAKGVTN